VIGIFCILAWLGGRDEAAASAKWPSVPGVITDMNISESVSSDGSRVRHADVKYSYSVSGKSFQGNRIQVEASTDVDDAQRYPKGTAVTVYYNPANAQSAVLEQGGSGMIVWGIAGFGFLVWAGYTLFSRRKAV